MTVAAELAKRHQRMEYFLCIEGVGWPTDENDLSAGFDGDVFIVDDLDGTLASDLGCTVHHGLSWSGSVGDSLDVVTGQYSQGQLTFEIQDVDGWLEDNYRPLLNGLVTSLAGGVIFKDTTINITDGTALDEGDVVWIGGQEAVLLGVKTTVSGDIRRYTGSTRAYLGTHRGMLNGYAQTIYGFYWPAETTVYDWRRFWHDAMVDLYMHAPGESAANCLRIWSGKLRGTEREISGNVWSLSAVSDVVRDYSRTWNAVDMEAEGNVYTQIMPTTNIPVGNSVVTVQGPGNYGEGVLLSNTQRDRYTEKLKSKYVIAEGYRYRTEPGGTGGMRLTWDTGGIQALTTSAGDENTIMRFLQVGGKVYLCKRPAVGPTVLRRYVELEAFSALGQNDAIDTDEDGRVSSLSFEAGTQARWLLDHWFPSWEINHFAYNKIVSWNPVDVLLAFLTSRDYETLRATTLAVSPGTASSINFTVDVGSTDLYVGMALHCVEGNNKGEARVITANAVNVITVEEPFSNAPGTSEEYQVRNSIYDTLPVGWGVGVPWYRIDIAAFEAMRDKHFHDARLAKFILGTQDKIEILKMLREYICGPYGIYFTQSRTTGKLTPNYIGLAQGDGVVEDYVAMGEGDIIEAGPINYNVEKPCARVWLKLRLAEEKLVGVRTGGDDIASATWPNATKGAEKRAPYGEVKAEVPAIMGGDTYDLPVAQGELLSFKANGVDEVKLEALFNSTGADKTWLVNRANMLAKFFSVPPPTVQLKVDSQFITTVQAGTMVKLTKAGFANPFATSKGWSDVVGVVTSSRIANPTQGPSLDITVVLLTDLNGGRVAPASKLDGNRVFFDGTSDFFIVAPTAYTVLTGDKDFYGFAVGDKIDLFDASGAVYAGAEAGPYTISGFGTNNSQTPEGATGADIIRISENIDSAALAAAITINHYLTLADWSVSNTTRMEQYAAYADASADLSGGDEARTYG